ncbi:MAG: glutamate--ammonia ligase, partial [Verrucomicrobiales bacterium]|nr:glutamate--ammonia ligase [Verrucomicrobiales bacterium]
MRTRALYCDFLGLPKGKYIQTDLAKSGNIGFAACALAVSFDRDLLNIPGTGLFDGIPDMKLALEKERYKSWQDNTEIALGDLKFEGKEYDLCPRTNLKKIIKEFNDLDLKPMVGLEFEAYVFERDEDGVWIPYNTPGAFVYGTGPSNDPKNLMGKIWERATEMGLPVESINGEYDNGQFELTLGFDEALKACDNAFLFKTMAKEIAFQEGLILSFMPKPIPERGGSGLHVNFSFVDKSKINVIEKDGKLSEIANDCISGLIHHHEGLSALLASTVNSYDRLQPASMAGYWANWAGDHRMVTIRTSTSSSNSARIEHRTADGAGNPYI